MTRSASEHHPICPKCGYDQSGEIATWAEQCPIEGICPECGLRFDWADVFDPSRVHLAWYVEHADRKRDMLRRTPITLWFLLVPNRFWKRVSVERPIYVARLWTYVGCVVLASYLVTTLVSIAVSVYSSLRWNQLYTSFQNQNPGSSFPVEQYMTDMWSVQYWLGITGSSLLHPLRMYGSGSQMVLLIGGMALLWAVVLAVVPTTRRIAKVRVAHIHRAAAWSCLAIALSFVVVSASDSVSSAFAVAGRGLNPNWPGLFNVTQVRFMQAEAYTRLLLTGVFLVSAVWIQWFWISACVVAWRIRSLPLLLLALIASLLAGYTVFMYLSVY